MHIYKQKEWRTRNLSQTPTPTLHFKKLYACKLRIKKKTNQCVLFVSNSLHGSVNKTLISQQNLVKSCSIFPFISWINQVTSVIDVEWKWLIVCVSTKDIPDLFRYKNADLNIKKELSICLLGRH